MTEVETQVSDVDKAVKAERERILVLILANSAKMASDYKNTIRHTGGLLTQSMVYAYSKCFNDVVKLITKTKETYEKPVQPQEK